MKRLKSPKRRKKMEKEVGIVDDFDLYEEDTICAAVVLVWLMFVCGFGHAVQGRQQCLADLVIRSQFSQSCYGYIK